MKYIYFLLFLLLGILSCSKGPSHQALQDLTQKKLDTQFSPGTFVIKDFSRRGSYSYNKTGDPADHLLIYYKAEIAFLKDYRFSDWEGLNIGSLTSVLGATPAGLAGLKPTGNKKGDLLVVNGLNNFRWNNDQWESIPFNRQEDEMTALAQSRKEGGFVHDIEEEGRYFQGDLPLHKQYMLELAKVAADFLKQGEDENIHYLQKNLEELIKETNFKMAKSRGWNTLATGPLGGEYHSLGAAIESTQPKQKQKFKAFFTSGSQENCELA